MANGNGDKADRATIVRRRAEAEARRARRRTRLNAFPQTPRIRQPRTGGESLGLQPISDSDAEGLLERTRGLIEPPAGANRFAQFLTRPSASDVTRVAGPNPDDPAAVERAFKRARRGANPQTPLVDLVSDVARQGARGVAEAGVTAGEGISTIAEAVGIGEGPSGKTRAQVEAFYGDPTTRAGAVGRAVGRIGAELGLFLVPGAGVRGLAKGTAIAGRTAGRASSRLAVRGIQAGTRPGRFERTLSAASRSARRGGSVLERVGAPRTRRGAVLQDLAFGAPVDIAISAAAPEESLAGFIGTIAPDATVFPGGPSFEAISKSLVGRTMLEAALGSSIGGPISALLFRAPQAVLPGAARHTLATLAGDVPADEAIAARALTALEEHDWRIENMPAALRGSPEIRRRLEQLKRVPARLAAVARPLAGATAGVGVGTVYPIDPTTNRSVAVLGFGVAGLALGRGIRTLNRIGGFGEISTHFWSRMERRIKDAPFERGTPEQWLARIREGVSKDELEFTGMADMLENATELEIFNGKTITRDELLTLARRNSLPVNDIVLTADGVNGASIETGGYWGGMGDGARELAEEHQSEAIRLLGRVEREFDIDLDVHASVERTVEDMANDPGNETDHFNDFVASVEKHLSENFQDLESVGFWFDNLDLEEQTRLLSLEEDDWGSYDVLRGTKDVPGQEKLEFGDLDEDDVAEIRSDFERAHEMRVLSYEDRQDIVHRVSDAGFDEMTDAAESIREGEALDSITDDITKESQYGSYVEDGEHTDYQEILITLDPDGFGTGRPIAGARGYSDISENDGVWIIRDGDGSYRAAATEQQAQMMVEPRAYRLVESPHWSGFNNIIAHARTTRRRLTSTEPVERATAVSSTKPQGEDVLYIEEFQSDWAQEGRTSGFQDVGVAEILKRDMEALGISQIVGFGIDDLDRVSLRNAEMIFRRAYAAELSQRYNVGDRVKIRGEAELDDFFVEGDPDATGHIQRDALDITEEGREVGQPVRPSGRNFIVVEANPPAQGSLFEPPPRTFTVEDLVTGDRAHGVSAALFEIDYGASSIAGDPLLTQWRDLFNRLSAFQDANLGNRNRVPLGPFSKTEGWIGLVLRRLIAEAVENGYNRVAWTRGSQQAARWNRAVHENVDEIRWSADALSAGAGTNDHRVTLAVYRDGNLLGEKTYRRDSLDAAVGRTMAEQINTELDAGIHAYDLAVRDPVTNALRSDLVAPDRDTQVVRGTLRGENLVVGERGFLTLYDEMIPRVVRKELKRLFKYKAPLDNIQFEDMGDVSTQTSVSRLSAAGTTEEVDVIHVSEAMRRIEQRLLSLGAFNERLLVDAGTGTPFRAESHRDVTIGRFDPDQMRRPGEPEIVTAERGNVLPGQEAFRRADVYMHNRNTRAAEVRQQIDLAVQARGRARLGEADEAVADLRGMEGTLASTTDNEHIANLRIELGRANAESVNAQDTQRLISNLNYLARVRERMIGMREEFINALVPMGGVDNLRLSNQQAIVEELRLTFGETTTSNDAPINQSFPITDAMRQEVATNGLPLGAAPREVLQMVAAAGVGASAGAAIDEDNKLRGFFAGLGVGIAAGRGLPIVLARVRALNEAGVVALGREFPADMPGRSVEQHISILAELGRIDAAQNLEDFMRGSQSRTIVFRGDNKGSRFGTRFLKNRQSESAGFFFTEDARIASNYAVGKNDAGAYAGYEEWYEIPVFRGESGRADKRRRQPNLDNAWHHLTKQQRDDLIDTLLRAYEDEEGLGMRFGDIGDSVVGGPEGWAHFVQRENGDWLRAAKEVWLNGGTLFDREEGFAKLLRRAGIPFRFTSAMHDSPAVMPLFLSIKKPIDAGGVQRDLIEAVRRERDRARGKPASAQEKMEMVVWGSTTEFDFRTWATMWLDDVEQNSTMWATRIHPRFARIAQELGYDGIRDVGGKFGGPHHPVWIAFEPGQMKSAIGNSGEFRAPFSITDQSQRTLRGTKGRVITGNDDALERLRDQPLETVPIEKPLAEHSVEELQQLQEAVSRNQQVFDLIQEGEDVYTGNLGAARHDALALQRELDTRTSEPPPGFGERGQASAEAIGVLAGAGVGAGIGAVTDAEHPLVGAFKGAVGGAVVGAGVVSFARQAKTRIRPRPKIDPALEERMLRVLDDLQGDLETHRLKLNEIEGEVGRLPIRQEQAAGEAAAVVTQIDPDEYVNVAKFGLDPDGEVRLRSEVERLVNAGIISRKRVITNAETRREASRMGLDVEDVLDLPDDRRLTGAEMLGIRNIINTNIDSQRRLSERLARSAHPAGELDLLSDAERSAIEYVMQSMDAQNEALLARFTEARSQTGRDLQNLKIVAHNTLDPAIWMSKARRMLADQPITDEIQARIMEFIDKRDRAGLVRYVASLRQATIGEQLAALWKAGLLTGPPTHLANIFGNFSMLLLETSKDPVAFVADRLLRAFTGLETKAPSFRGLIAESARGAQDGWKKARLVMQGVSIDDAAIKIDMFKEVIIDLPFLPVGANAFLDMYQKAIFRSLTAMDRVFHGAALRRSLYEQARIMERLNPSKNVEEWFLSPSDQMVAQAVFDAQVATFTNRGVLGGIATGAKRGARQGFKVGGLKFEGNDFVALLMEGIVPFSNTPANVMARVWDATPFGIINTTADVWRLYRHLRKYKKLGSEIAERLETRITGEVADPAVRTNVDLTPEQVRELGAPAGLARQAEQERFKAALFQKRAVERVGRMAVGAVPIYAGFVLAKEKLMSGRYPTTQRERDQWALSGKQENSVLTPGADGIPRWRTIERISPPGNLMVFGAYMHDILQDSELTTTERFGEALTAVGVTVTEQTFLRGVRDAITALTGERGAGARWIKNQISAPVPAIIRRIAYALDPVVRERETLGQAVQRVIPFYSKKLPARIDQLGDEVVREGGIMRQLFDPFSSRIDRRGTEPLIAELERVGAGITRLRQNEGESREDFRLRLRVWGQALKRQLMDLIDNPIYLEQPAIAEALEASLPQFSGRSVNDIAQELQRELIEGRVSRVRQALRRTPLAEAASWSGVDTNLRAEAVLRDLQEPDEPEGEES